MTRSNTTPRDEISQSHIRRILRRAGPVGASTCLIASKVDAPIGEVARALEAMCQQDVEQVGRAGLGGAQWRLQEVANDV